PAPGRTGAPPGDDGSLRIADRDDRVVEGGVDVHDPLRHHALDLPAARRGGLTGGGLLGRPLLASRLLGRGLFRLRHAGSLRLLGLGRRGLLPRDRSPRSLSRPGVRMGALATHGEVASVPQPPIAAEIHQALDATGHVAAEVALDLVPSIDHATYTGDLAIVQVVALPARLHLRLGADAEGRAPADTVNVGQRDFHTLVARQVDTGDACHGPSLSLSLFVPGVRAQHTHHPLASDHLALLADCLHGGPYLHGIASDR